MFTSHPIGSEALRILIIALTAFLVALGMTPLVLRFLRNISAGKQIRTSESAPIFSNLHRKKEGTPTMGGVIIWGTVLGLAALFWVFGILFNGFFGHLNFIDRAQTYLPLAALFFAAILGLIDDFLGVLKIGSKGGGLPVKGKLIIYTLLSMIGAWWFFIKLGFTQITVPFLGNFDIGFWYVPVFIFVIVGSAFSANETDGLDGLLGGVSLFAFGALTVVSFVLGRYNLAAMSSAVIGALLAFLWFNIYPAKFFMGDTGSMALGITLGVIAALTNTVVLLPLFAIILVIEALSVIIQVISKKFFKRKVFISAPIHHHFEASGWPESQVTMRFWIISVVCVGIGLALFFLGRIW
ncbi:MAG: phospho-N-acetylmuramoyl-pentapeptide-transferase [bacterium]